ncbi:phosphodiester glycosidase family protein [Pedobacter deserti]|uniref:phosphodiester glycosidase family protein n=1 Tax=Pedobacter deserti TaxID=2817382 RepID=UPI0021091223|nr:phosphodiester glycosidase family protein [Pedobacter sp. SYSU D00382]
MFKRPAFLLIMIFCLSGAYGQDTDSLALVRAKWTKKRIAKGVKLLVHHFSDKEMFGANQNISYLEVKQKKGRAPFALGSEPSVLRPTSAFGISADALAAVNGTFFDVKNGGSVDFIKANGQVEQENRLDNNQRASHQRAAVAIRDGRLDIYKWDGSDKWEQDLPATEVMTSGPLLSFKGKQEVLDSGAFNVLRHPRTAVGVKADGKVLLVTIDGRHTSAAGMSLFELSKVMRWLGCVDAINLDGGGSTTLWVNSTGVVNYPSDNRSWDHKGERKVANVILIKKKK